MKEPDVTIITSMFSSTDEFLKKLDKSVKSQRYSGKITHVYINDNVNRPRQIKGLNIINHSKNLGVTQTIKKGFESANTEIVISLLDDCLPSSKDWLKKLVSPLSDKNVAATSSKVELPFDFWNKFDFFAKALTEREQKVLVTGLDEKGCAYKKSIIKEYGYFDTKNFRNGGEDTDLTIRLSKKWKVISSEAKVYHLHFATAKSRIKKENQYAQITGIVSRKHFFNLHWYVRAHMVLKILLFFLFFLSLFPQINPYFPISTYVILAAIFIIANRRLLFQVARLWKDPRIFLLPFFNVFIYGSYVVNFLYSFIFKPRI